ncbi:ribonuclease HII [Bacillus massilinigeriensis]|uniref:ribonuclease HII n=1 Tax=Bacillus mediterraneensis TaxID=1805474 RepID=UPI0008F81B43|nr:ribonuclease HII [Bacillus mediterraneensis]
MKLTIEEIGKRLAGNSDPDSEFIREISQDERAGVQRVLKKWMKLRELEKHQNEKFLEMSQFELDLRNKGYRNIAGIDEAGRGPLAGPVVAAAVILPEQFFLPGIDDSKKLTKVKRESFCKIIKEKAVAWGVGIVSPAEIDCINILNAAKKAMVQAVGNLEVVPDFLLIDAVQIATPYPYEALIKGDARSVSIAAASIIAKVTRDNLMEELDALHPKYGFAKNQGYGTQEHIDAIKKYGITSFHRKSFEPVKSLVAD